MTFKNWLKASCRFGPMRAAARSRSSGTYAAIEIAGDPATGAESGQEV